MRNTSHVVSAAIVILSSACASSSTFTSNECGIAFSLPDGWAAESESGPHLRGNHEPVGCSVAIRPPGWTEAASNSRWNVEDPPILLTVFSDQTTFAEALIASGFEEDEYGKGFGVPGGYGAFDLAEPYHAGTFSGLVAYSFFRGFIRDEALLRGESNVFSGETATVVLKDDRSRPFAFQYLGGTPDEGVDWEPALERIARTFQFLSGARARRRPTSGCTGHEPRVAVSPALYYSACGSRR